MASNSIFESLVPVNEANVRNPNCTDLVMCDGEWMTAEERDKKMAERRCSLQVAWKGEK